MVLKNYFQLACLSFLFKLLHYACCNVQARSLFCLFSVVCAMPTYSLVTWKNVNYFDLALAFKWCGGSQFLRAWWNSLLRGSCFLLFNSQNFVEHWCCTEHWVASASELFFFSNIIVEGFQLFQEWLNEIYKVAEYSLLWVQKVSRFAAWGRVET